MKTYIAALLALFAFSACGQVCPPPPVVPKDFIAICVCDANGRCEHVLVKRADAQQ